MESSTFADRLRGVLGSARRAANPELGTRAGAPGTLNPELGTLERVLGGEWRQYNSASCFVVERKQEPSAKYGRESVGTIATRLADGSAEAPLITGGSPAQPPFLFFDLEATGLSGGAGTHAFLVGFGWFDAFGAFITRQLLLTRFADERPLLAAVAEEIAQAGALVSFNGKSFDAPVLETRYLFHRLEWTGVSVPHIDVLHPARRFWGGEDRRRSVGRDRSGAPRGVKNACSLIALEQQILGAPRTGDVPGFEIPGRYFQFIRSRDARPLVDVLEHNRLDLLSLAGLTARLLDLVRVGPQAARDACEALALGAVYARAGLEARARHAYASAVAASGLLPVVRCDALRALALLSRRARRHDEAAVSWQQLLDIRGCPPHIVREATEALAIHHEHRVRDLAAAQAFALRSLQNGEQPRWHEAVRHRLARIQNKMRKSEVSSLTCDLSLEP
jgi:uncharacterized protein YprB with RNaseH-like and TPR domain